MTQTESENLAYEIRAVIGGTNLQRAMAMLERAVLVQVMEQFDGNTTLAARYLGIGRTTLVEKRRKHEIGFTPREGRKRRGYDDHKARTSA